MLLDIDRDRVAKETLPHQAKKLFDNKDFGVLRFATYIQNYSNYGTYLEFIKNATDDEWQEIERMYLDDWNTRLYSDVFRITIGELADKLADTISEDKMKKLLKSDIKEFYNKYENKIKRYSKNNQ